MRAANIFLGVERLHQGYKEEEVVLALRELKRRVAAGRDELMAEMVSCDFL